MRYGQGMLKALGIISIVGVGFIGCATMLSPDKINAPPPISGNSGKYMCPYTSDGVVAEWVDKGMQARLGATVGSALGATAGTEVLKQIPLIGGWLGSKGGEAIGRKIAIDSSGGEDFIRKTSDLSFDSLDDLSVFMYVNYSGHNDYQKVLSLTEEIYPKLKKEYPKAIMAASKRARSA